MAVSGPDVFNNDTVYRGNVNFQAALGFAPPNGFLTDLMVNANALINDGKMVHRYNLEWPQTGVLTTTILNQMQVVLIAQAAGSIRNMQAAILGAIATGADRTVTVDLLRSTGGAAFATVLSAPIVFTNTSVLRALSTAVISAASYLANDFLLLNVVVAGAAGAQAQGLACQVRVAENPF
jgi:hypothetical protein